MKKKKLRLKPKYRKKLIYLIIFLIIIGFSINKYRIYKYHQTNEYKLLQKGYTEKETKDIENKLTDEQIKNYLKEDKIEYLDELINDKYFINKNLDKYIEYKKQNKKKEINKLVPIVNVGSYRDFYKDTNPSDTSKGDLILVNKYNVLDEKYKIGETVKFESKYSYGEVEALPVAYNAFVKMAEAAKEDGITLIVTSGARTYAHQEEIYTEMRNINGKIYADAYAARAGASEHETGLALDVFTYGATTDNFESTDTYKWLDKHAQDYGFILRYPKDKKYLTGYNPESWHFRYIGKKHAKKLKELGITYDEYYAYFIEGKDENNKK